MQQHSKQSFSSSFDIVNFLRVMATMFVFILHGREFVENLSHSKFLNVVTFLPAWAGVWIFLFLSGYTVGLGFFKGRYPVLSDNAAFSPRKLLQFYWGRFLKIAPYYYIYLFLWDLLSGSFYLINALAYDPKLLLKVLLFSFNGAGGVSGMGHLWYISTAMQMYLIMPFAYLLIRKIKTPAQSMVCFSVIVFCGLALRLYLLAAGTDWYSIVYTASICNIDLVVCGMLISHFKTTFAPAPYPNKLLLGVSSLLLIALVCYNAVIYGSSSARGLLIYQYILPSCYILVSSVLIIYWGNLNYRSVPLTLSSFLRNPLCVIDWFSAKSYYFYIFHIAALSYAAAAMKTIPALTLLPATVSIITQYALAFSFALIGAQLFSKLTFKFSRKRVPAPAAHGKEANHET